MEKNGTINLTSEDLESFYKGEVSDRILQLWNLTYQELEEIVNSNNYIEIK